MAKRITICAGIDTGKRKLDVALDGRQQCGEKQKTQIHFATNRYVPDRTGSRALVLWPNYHKRRTTRLGLVTVAAECVQCSERVIFSPR
ncbi:hypothetical protein ABIB73_007026 [Bradyrhizobium sp. F1.4.3]|uniref:hypothetical protein n=1 Tax=Bradyrhizobium sp. F1.4.3 TaxID=3156356 RepID=UPI0033910D4B